jgi:hypothetical protein
VVQTQHFSLDNAQTTGSALSFDWSSSLNQKQVFLSDFELSRDRPYDEPHLLIGFYLHDEIFGKPSFQNKLESPCVFLGHYKEIPLRVFKGKKLLRKLERHSAA